MVNMPSAKSHVVKWADASMNRLGDRSYDENGDEEPKRCEEQTLPPCLREMRCVDRPESASCHGPAQSAENSGEYDRQEPEAALCPGHLSVRSMRSRGCY